MLENRSLAYRNHNYNPNPANPPTAGTGRHLVPNIQFGLYSMSIPHDLVVMSITGSTTTSVGTIETYTIGLYNTGENTATDYTIHLKQVGNNTPLATIKCTDILYEEQRPSNWGAPLAGTEENPFLISNLLNLRWLSEVSEDWYIDANTLVHFKQTSDIDAIETISWNNGVGFKPIGFDVPNGLNSFIGVYDGDGYTIDNLYINIADTINIIQVGLFNALGMDTIIKNLGLNDFYYNGTGDYYRPSIGGIAAYSAGATISKNNEYNPNLG